MSHEELINNRLKSLQKLGLGCGPGCSCWRRQAANMSDEDLCHIQAEHREWESKVGTRILSGEAIAAT